MDGHQVMFFICKVYKWEITEICKSLNVYADLQPLNNFAMHLYVLFSSMEKQKTKKNDLSR